MNKYITAEEKALFRNEMKNLRLPVSSASLDAAPLPGPDLPSLSTVGAVPLLAPEELVSYKANGVRDRELRQLGKTKLAIEESLDLHGYALTEAREHLVSFLVSAFNREIQLVHIIHGKNRKGGFAVLKSRLVSWLKQISWVLAFRSARQEDGGAGALYVLLRRRDS